MNRISLLLAVVLLLSSCETERSDQPIPERYQPFIHNSQHPVEYRSTHLPDSLRDLPRPETLSQKEVHEDLDLLEYLMRTSFSGYEYWMEQGIDFETYFKRLRALSDSTNRLPYPLFEAEVTRILDQMLDGHISMVGDGYYGAYYHKSAYFSDVLLAEITPNKYKVIETHNPAVLLGAEFTEPDPTPYLFETLAREGERHFLLGKLSVGMVDELELSFDGVLRPVPFRKSRLLMARFEDQSSYSRDDSQGFPQLRITSFHGVPDTDVKAFMSAGNELRKAPLILVNLFNNGGGSSVYPQTFIRNLNGSVQWETYWAELSSPAIVEYYAKMELENISAGHLYMKKKLEKQIDAARSNPTRRWDFFETQLDPTAGQYDGRLILLTNRRVLSAGENMVGASRSLKNQLIIGENTGGCAMFSSGCEYILPHSKLLLNLPRQFIFIPGLEEGVGYLPDYWLDTHDPVGEVVKWIQDPGGYQFRYEISYEALVAQSLGGIALPEDLDIRDPSSDLPTWQQAYTGKWFGVNDGILDHMLVVEHMESSQDVQGIYAWGIAYQWGIDQPGWMRLRGGFEDGRLLLRSEDEVITISYEIQGDGSMTSIYTRPGVRSIAELTRI